MNLVGPEIQFETSFETWRAQDRGSGRIYECRRRLLRRAGKDVVQSRLEGSFAQIARHRSQHDGDDAEHCSKCDGSRKGVLLWKRIATLRDST